MTKLATKHVRQDTHATPIQMDRTPFINNFKGQMKTLWKLMKTKRWTTLADLEAATGFQPTSIAATLRNFRREQYGSFIVDRRYAGDGIYEYRLNF